MPAGVVQHALSGDCLLVLERTPAGGSAQRQVYLAGIIAPRMAVKSAAIETKDEPGAFESREFLRRWLVGKQVSLEIIRPTGGRSVGYSSVAGRTNVSIKFEGKDAAAQLVERGLAKVTTSAGPCPPPNYDELKVLEQRAKAEQEGIWNGSNPMPVRSIKWLVGDMNLTKAFAESHRNESPEAVIEHVRDAGCLRCYFIQEQMFAQCLLSGIIAPGWKGRENDTVGEPLAAEAKKFVEARLLGRSVPMRIDGADGYGNLLVTPKHAKGDVRTLLVEEGLANVNDATARGLPEADALRAALVKAQREKKNRWASSPGMEGRQSTSPAADKSIDSLVPHVNEASGVPSDFPARLIEIHSADSLSIVDITKIGGNPNRPDLVGLLAHQCRVYLSSIRCPRPRSRIREAEPYYQEAIDLVREMAARKRLTCVVDYARVPLVTGDAVLPPASDDLGRMHFVTLFIQGTKKSINAELVSRGLATVIKHRVSEDRSGIYQELLDAEEAAKNARVGLHNPKPAPKRHFNDLVGPDNAQKARALETSFRREQKIQVIVTQVFNASRYILDAPTHSARLTFVLSGVRSPQPARQQRSGTAVEGDLYGAEATEWARYHLLHQTYWAVVEAVDRGGNFLGKLYPLESFGRDSVNLRVLAQGCARVDEQRLDRVPEEFIQAQKEAAEKRLGMWAFPELADEVLGRGTRDAMAPPTGDSLPSTTATIQPGGNWSVAAQLLERLAIGTKVVVSQIESSNTVYIQTVEDVEKSIPKVKELCDSHGEAKEDLSSEKFSAQKPPRVGDICLARYSADDTWYRARVIECHGLRATVLYVDYGNTDKVSLDRLVRCPAELNVLTKPALATRVMLAGIKATAESERAAVECLNAMATETDSFVIAQMVEGATPAVVLTRGDGGACLNVELVQAGQYRFGGRSAAVQGKWRESLEAAMRQAKSERRGMWFHGDVGSEDDELDDDMPVLGRY